MGFVITLILVGLVLLFAEILLIPGVGIAGILGLLSLAGSSYYAFVQMSTLAGVIVTSVNVVLVVALTVWVLRANTWKKLTLETNIASKADKGEPKVTSISSSLATFSSTAIVNSGAVINFWSAPYKRI